jgi:MSHA biogenesis protein MshP
MNRHALRSISNTLPRKGPGHMRGFAAIAALFLLVVLAALGGYMVSFSNTQQLTATQDLQGTRAYWAARAGLEWALGAIAADPTTCPPASTTVNTGSSFTVSIVCTPRTYLENGVSVKIFQIESMASTGTVGTLGFVERSVSATYEVAP